MNPSTNRNPRTNHQQVDQTAAQRAGELSVSFCAALFARVAAKASGTGANVFVSPYSVATALALVLEGARGETAAQLKTAIGYAADADNQKLHHDIASLINALNRAQGIELSVANALWVADNFKLHPDFAKRTRALKAEARNVDFADQTEAARLTINTWVEQQTKDKIKNLMPPGSLLPSTPLVLTNAIYFKGAWAEAFKKENTTDRDFHLLGGSSTKLVPMMEQNKLNTRYASFDHHAMLQLPYKGNEVVMLVLLPHDNSPAALDALVAERNLKQLGRHQRNLTYKEVNVKLPRFKFEYEVELSQVLQDMGVTTPFTDGAADFGGMVAPDTTHEGLWIGNVHHKAFVDVNEEGTEAVAATGSAMASSAVAKVVDFVVDRPFVFVLYHTGLKCPLFVGKVLDPSTTTA